MTIELKVNFPDKGHVNVSFDGQDSGNLAFTNPLTDKDHKDIQWYIEVYAAHSLGDPDDSEAKRIAANLPVWGKKLFDAVFDDQAARRLFNRFQDRSTGPRLLTISAEDPEILALPWELLHDSSSGGVFLFNENPRISIRRGVPGAMGGREPFKPDAKECLHLLFVVSRPEGPGLIDPRSDPAAVLDALDEHAAGCFTWEFLRPATMDGLVKRLNDRGKPAVDILHFDGHGRFDRKGVLAESRDDAGGDSRFPSDEALFRDQTAKSIAGSPSRSGYLLFEKPDGKPDLVSAEQLGQNLHQHKVGLIILSACQTAAVGHADAGAKEDASAEEAAKADPSSAEPARNEAMGSVAVRLTAAGIPAVVAMTHSVLYHTTRELFHELYGQIAQGRGVGEALDTARNSLWNNPEKYEVQRGPERKPLELHDWFIPALYHRGDDVPLLKQQREANRRVQGPVVRTNLPKSPESCFFGRRRELWDIERWLTGTTRRISITGFGGQGKTALAQEAGRWLTLAGMFQAAVFVDYSRTQSLDALAVAVSTIGSVLGESLIDADAATGALKKTPCLVILDNLESLAAEALQELLNAAVQWSEAGRSRVLCTTRTPDFRHPEYGVEGTNIHRRIVLSGLGSPNAPDDALEWLAELMRLPPAPTAPVPKRAALISLFERVKFHPLSIRVLAELLKTEVAAILNRDLEKILAGQGAGPQSLASTDATVPELVASLQLSLNRLDPAAREMLPRLGVFQGGAFETRLLEITKIDEQVWPRARKQLESAALLESEPVPGVNPPFLRFHPTLAPMLWTQLPPDEQAARVAAHSERYCALVSWLHYDDLRNPHGARAMAWLELPNLLHGVHAALDAGDPKAADFAESMNWFLKIFGFKQEAEASLARAREKDGEIGSDAWYLAQSNRGEQLLNEGHPAKAAGVIRSLLEALGPTPSFRRGNTLGLLGRCLSSAGRPDLAEQCFRDGITVSEQLEQTEFVKWQRCTLLSDLGNVLRDQGRYAEARAAYEEGLEGVEELGDLRRQGVNLGQLGTLAMFEGKLQEAADRHQTALELFQQLGEPAAEAIAWHQLGTVFQTAGELGEAERHYREAARICEELGMITGPDGAAGTWNNLAQVTEAAGKPEAAERWYRKALEAYRGGEEKGNLSRVLNNLSDLLTKVPGRLAEARHLAEEALAIGKMIDSGAAEIWKTYRILVEISDKEADITGDRQLKAELHAQAREYRRLAREAIFNIPGTRHELRRHSRLIVGTVLATQDQEIRQQLEEHLPQEETRGWGALVAAIRSILHGERNADVLCEALDPEDSMIVEAILQGLADPSTLKDLMPEEDEGADDGEVDE